MSEIAKKEGSNVIPHPGVSEETKMMMQMIEQVALNPDADVEKLRAVMDMKMQMFNRGAEIEFNAAMALAQSEMEPVVARSRNDQTNSNYAKLEHIIEQISPIWSKHGFAITFGSGDSPREGWYRVECEVSHRAGHSKKYHADLPPDTVGIKGSVNKTPIHGFGSTMSYGRRYLTCLVFNIPIEHEDNDGNTQAPAVNYNRIDELFAGAQDVKALVKVMNTLKPQEQKAMKAKFDARRKELMGVKQ